ncbi:MAG: polysaccharide biosynthesis/export family protein [Pseudobdellovibrionaceae bacterium]|nr:polysaccharide biosynthesis/export family protein [Pseudobdellovibrionaceae bacterium]
MSDSRYLSLRTLLVVAGLSLSLGLSACAVPSASDIDAPNTIDATQPAFLNSGDRIKLSVYGEEDLSGEYMLDQRGVITLPMVGEVSARGMSQSQLKDALRQAFVEGGYLSRPLISVDIAALRQVFILGEVNAPGAFPYEPSLTSLKVVALAGGYTPRAAQGRLLVDRTMEGGAVVRMNASDLTPILPGDTIIVRERIF